MESIPVPCGTVIELTATSSVMYDDPVRDVLVECEIESNGISKKGRAFWNGGNEWCFRTEAAQEGIWQYRFICSDTTNGGLKSQQGVFQVVPFKGDNALYCHGSLCIAPDGVRFMHRDGTPFFWMADTAWNGVLKARECDWRRYLETRNEQGFTAIQCVLTPWRAFPEDAAGEKAFYGADPIRINPEFFKRLDTKVREINNQGLIAALVVIWSCRPHDPGNSLSESDLNVLGHYIVDRYGAYQVVWFLGGDGDYRGEKAQKWKRIARDLFPEPRNRLVTMHPGGQNWVAQEFRDEPWYDFISYQSGHGDNAEHTGWLVAGPPAQQWQKNPPRPIIDLEPRYEHHISYHAKRYFTGHEVRKALYWNLLNAPTAGVSYGHNSIWPWCEQREFPLDHSNAGETPPWYEALGSEGAHSVKILRGLFDSIGWQDLYPAPYLLLEQPGLSDPNLHVAAAQKKNGSATALVYLPHGGTVKLDTAKLARRDGWWFDLQTGRFAQECTVAQDGLVEAPDKSDWLLVL